MRSFDVLVIGGGVAGVAAALGAAAHGRRVGLVRAGPGATALAAGGWRGPLPGGLARALAAAGLPHEPPAGPLPHPHGDLRRHDLAAPAQAAAVVGDGALVCGIAGLPGFVATALARLWGDAARVRLAAATLDAGPLTPPAGWSPVALAAALDREPGPLADALARAVRDAGATHAILPPVLGLERGEAVRAALAAAAGVPVGEMLGVPPSVPGWRLDRALLAAAAAAGVEVIPGRAGDPTVEDGRISAVRVQAADAAELRVAARAVVLAAGKFAGGGIVADERLREPALGCPVWVAHLGAAFDAPEPLALTRPEREAAQPLLGAGVHDDGSGRPVDWTGDVVYSNVRVAGSVRAGRETARLGLGEAAADGWAMGEAAARAAAG